MSLALEVRDLGKSFGDRRVLDGVTFAVRTGEVFALLGANGAGKTTTISILTTLLAPDRGSAFVAGYDVLHRPEEVKRRISLTGQSAAVDDILTGAENLTLFATLSGFHRVAARRRARELLERFDLEDAAHQRVATYSGGMRRRLDLALSFVFAPQVLFLDEPTTGLDARSRREVWDVIGQLAQGGTTVFLTTQYLEEADHLADRVAVLDAGRIAALGTPAELKARVGRTTVEVRDGAGNLIRHVPTDGTLTGVRQILNGLERSGVDGIVSLRSPTLDDVFLALTASGTSGSRTDSDPTMVAEDAR